MTLEMYRAIIPGNKCINDNWGNHYRPQMGNIEWLAWQYESIKNGYWKKPVGRGAGKTFERESYIAPGGFVMPDLENSLHWLGDGSAQPLLVHCEVWRCTGQLFDPHNYAHTVKQPMDMLVHDGYLKDDNWHYVQGMCFSGGGAEVWGQRRLQAANEGELPAKLTPRWWREQMESQRMKVADDKTDLTGILVRILFERED